MKRSRDSLQRTASNHTESKADTSSELPTQEHTPRRPSLLCTHSKTQMDHLSDSEEESKPTRRRESSPSPKAPLIRRDFKFDHFEVYRTLGTGSYGRVLLVKDTRDQQHYALKRLKKSDIVRLKQVEHTNNERQLLERVSGSPFVVQLVGAFQDARYLYLIMEYVSGGELFGLLRRVRTLPSFIAQFYAAQIVLVLDHLHRADIVYRDLKPENVLIGQDGNLKLADFGFAKVVPDQTWTFCGTPEYLAPELVGASGSGYGKAVDWYALGVLIYEMLVGRPPFNHDNHLKLYDQIANDPVKFPSTVDPHAQSLIESLLEKNPTKRLGNLKGGVDDLKQHHWFKSVNWEYMERRQVRPPYKPRVAGPADASNFDRYPEDGDGPVEADEVDEFGKLFPHF